MNLQWNLKSESASSMPKMSQWWTLKEQVMSSTAVSSIKKMFKKPILTTETKMVNQIFNIDWFIEFKFRVLLKIKIISLIYSVMTGIFWVVMNLLVKQLLNSRNSSMIVNWWNDPCVLTKSIIRISLIVKKWLSSNLWKKTHLNFGLTCNTEMVIRKIRKNKMDKLVEELRFK